MIHLGDITAISGYTVPPVDVVIGGSPCQDLSVAGTRGGMRHHDLGDEQATRSGLFMEQIRVVKEMRDADAKRGRTGVFIRPRFMVWENVPGAFSSHKGEDFKIVLEETIRIAEPDAPNIPLPPKGKWPMADAWYGDGWSIAYRVLDAQFWGVPQRRRRIALVADFGGHAAPEILFIRESVQGNLAESGAPREEAPGITGSSTYPAISRSLTARNDGSPCIDRGPQIILQSAGFHHKAGATTRGIGYEEERAPTLMSEQQTAVWCLQGNIIDRDAKMNGSGIAPEPMFTLNTIDRHAVFDARGNGDGKTVCTMTGDHESRVTDYTALIMAHGQADAEIGVNIAPTLNCNHEQPIIGCFQNTGRGWWNQSDIAATLRTPCGGDSTKANLVAAVDFRNGRENPEINGTLQAKSNGGTSLNYNNVVRFNQTVRRLTPLECERLQGFPDGWTDIGEWEDSAGKKHSITDTPRYSALGNSIAIPPWVWVLKRISACYERDATMASLFDGIGGFPLIWERINGKGTAVWASEIEEFPMAITRFHFGE